MNHDSSPYRNRYSVASFSFYRLLRDGKQDMFRYIEDCRAMGMAQLDPWNGHLAPLIAESDTLRSGANWQQPTFSAAGLDYVDRVRHAAETAGLPFGCLAVDGAHIFEPTPEARAGNRAAAYRWLNVAVRLKAEQIRIDSGGTPEFPDDQFQLVVEGYNTIIGRARDVGIEVVMENHWGASNIPENIVKILDAVDGLGMLFDTNNFAQGMQQRGWELCAKYARCVHVKTFEFDANGNDPTVDLPRAIRMLIDSGYNGVWGIESVPHDGDEYGAVTKTRDLIERSIRAAQAGGAA